MVIGNSLAGSQPFGLAVVDTTARLVVVVPHRELPDFAGDNLDSLDIAVRFAHTYTRYNKCNTFLFVGYNTAEWVVDAGESYPWLIPTIPL